MKGYSFLVPVSSFVGRAVVFFFLTSVLSLFLYLIGNYQDFLDSTQLLLLGCLRASLSLQLVCSLWMAGFLIHRAVTEHRSFVARWILLGLSFCVSAVLLAALRMLQQWLRA